MEKKYKIGFNKNHLCNILFSKENFFQNHVLKYYKNAGYRFFYGVSMYLHAQNTLYNIHSQILHINKKKRNIKGCKKKNDED